jgi:Fe-S-cluster containining protein
MNSLKENVLAAAYRPEVRTEVRRVYADLQREIDRRNPLCVMSGRCCRFSEFGHRLYATTVELAAFVGELSEFTPDPATAGPAGECPFQSGKICRVRAFRPLGCRVYFCDSTAQEWQQVIYEQFHARLKQLHDDLSIPYSYVEWRFACQTFGLGL